MNPEDLNIPAEISHPEGVAIVSAESALIIVLAVPGA